MKNFNDGFDKYRNMGFQVREVLTEHKKTFEKNAYCQIDYNGKTIITIEDYIDFKPTEYFIELIENYIKEND